MLHFDVQVRCNSALDVSSSADCSEQIAAYDHIALLNGEISTEIAVARHESVMVVKDNCHTPQRIIGNGSYLSV